MCLEAERFGAQSAAVVDALAAQGVAFDAYAGTGSGRSVLRCDAPLSIVPEMDTSPGPGWTKGKDGQFYSHYFTYDDFPGARAVAGVFKVLAVLVLVAGSLSAVEAALNLHTSGTNNGNVIALVAGIVGGTIIAASAMAFFGYVLQLLVAIHFDVRHAESAKVAEDLKRLP